MRKNEEDCPFETKLSAERTDSKILVYFRLPTANGNLKANPETRWYRNNRRGLRLP